MGSSESIEKERPLFVVPSSPYFFMQTDVFLFLCHALPSWSSPSSFMISSFQKNIPGKYDPIMVIITIIIIVSGMDDGVSIVLLREKINY